MKYLIEQKIIKTAKAEVFAANESDAIKLALNAFGKVGYDLYINEENTKLTKPKAKRLK